MDFAQYLKENSSKRAGKEPLFLPGIYDEGSKLTWSPWTEPKPVTQPELSAAEREFNCILPAGYRTLMETIGPGIWADAAIPHPSALRPFDEAVGEMCGFIAVGFNVDGCGNYVAFNPMAEVKGAMYFCCHDPFGYAMIANSFDEWICKITEQKLADPKKGAYAFYDSLESFIDAVPQRAEQLADESKRPWWHFWK